ncbi:uncharacterized protein LOC121406531 [Lytechinus variegatus]|uniref:uncharacterized protein LOC121406531 n=1 Tax=Lytechinus variegatus TaxID=7654 RepID=UPI001BB1D87D|nr:uncharacterized protein LOC121406531 [Lytechinus variegatus]
MAALVILMIFFGTKWYHLRRRNQILLRSQAVFTSQEYFTLDPDMIQEETGPFQDLEQHTIRYAADGPINHVYNSIGDLPTDGIDRPTRLGTFTGARRDLSLPPLPINADRTDLAITSNVDRMIPEDCSGLSLAEDMDGAIQSHVIKANGVAQETTSGNNCRKPNQKVAIEGHHYQASDDNLYMETRTDECRMSFEHPGQEEGCLASSSSRHNTVSSNEEGKQSKTNNIFVDEDGGSGEIMVDNILYRPCTFNSRL